MTKPTDEATLDKPTATFYRDSVRFQPSYGIEGNPEIAICFCQDHPKLGCAGVVTTEVLVKNEDGSFETRNTLYVPTDEPRPVEPFTDLGYGEQRCNSCGMVLWSLSTRHSRHFQGCEYVANLSQEAQQ